MDPWLVSQLIIQATEALCPLVAVQPVYMHPYSAATMVATLGQLHERRVYLNMLAGGFKNDLIALNDTTRHDERYERTVEYTLIVKRLLFEPAPVSFAGRYYQVHNLKLTPSLPEHLLPGMLISGSSPAGLAAARAIGATAVQYPEPAEQMGKGQRPDGVRDGRSLFGPVAADEFYLSKLGLASGFRRAGYGAKILQEYLDRGAANGFRRFRLDVWAENRPAIGLYRSFGFQVVRELRLERAGMTYLNMALELREDDEG